MRTKFGAIVVAGLGKLGGHVFTGGEKGSFMKRKVSPINRSSSAQMVERSNISNISASWRALSQAQRVLWDNASKDYPHSNIFGSTILPSGFGLYLKINSNLINVGLPALSLPPASKSLHDTGIVSLYINNINNVMEVSFANVIGATSIYQVSCSMPIPPSVSFIKKLYRVIAALSSSATSPASIFNAFVEKNGLLAYAGKVVHLSITCIATGIGLHSQAQLAKAEILGLPVIDQSKAGLTFATVGGLTDQAITYNVKYIEQNICIATYGGSKCYIARSVDNGITWSVSAQVDSLIYPGALAYCGNGIVLIGAGNPGRILRSIDYGQTWIDEGIIGSTTQVVSAAYLEKGIVICGCKDIGHIYRSTNYGLTWSDLGNQAGEQSVYSMHYLEGGICLAGTGNHGHILRSTDYGATWSDLGQQFAQTGVYDFCYLGAGICLAAMGNGGLILRSINYGLTWYSMGQLGTNGRAASIAHLGNGVCLAGTGNVTGQLFRSLNYGQTWSLQTSFASLNRINQIALLPDGATLLATVGTDTNYIYKSSY
jgi:photosystem II stability/assembly factor-like uncharacterized protein